MELDVDITPPMQNPGEPSFEADQTVAAEQFREQAAACRRLALRSLTKAGKKGLDALGDHFDAQAFKANPLSLRR